MLTAWGGGQLCHVCKETDARRLCVGKGIPGVVVGAYECRSEMVGCECRSGVLVFKSAGMGPSCGYGGGVRVLVFFGVLVFWSVVFFFVAILLDSVDFEAQACISFFSPYTYID